jgi:hypothetical protein
MQIAGLAIAKGGKEPIKAADKAQKRRHSRLSGADWRDRATLNCKFASNGDTTMASGNDIKAAETTYGGFLTMLKWGSVVTVLVTVLVIALISG